MQSNFEVVATYGDGDLYAQNILESNSMPVVVSLPYDSNVASIQVFKNGQVLQKASLSAQLLEGIIKKIPDNAFRVWGECQHHRNQVVEETKVAKEISKYRKDLIKRVNRIQKMINSKNPREAIGSLEALILEIDRITVKNYTASDSSQLSQSDVISQIRSIIVGLEKDSKACDKNRK